MPKNTAKAQLISALKNEMDVFSVMKLPHSKSNLYLSVLAQFRLAWIHRDYAILRKLHQLMQQGVKNILSRVQRLSRSFAFLLEAVPPGHVPTKTNPVSNGTVRLKVWLISLTSKDMRENCYINPTAMVAFMCTS